MVDEGVRTLREGAGLLMRPDLYTLVLSGPERVRFLNGMLTGDVTKLATGRCLTAVKTSSRGRVEGVVRVRAEAQRLLIDVRAAVAEKVARALLQLLVMDDCVLGDHTDDRTVISIFGPKAWSVLEAAGLAAPEMLATDTFVEIEPGTLVRDDWLGVEGYELHVAPSSALPLVQALLSVGAREVDAEDVDVVRIESGVPLDGRDIDEDTIPMEARLDALLDGDKGCYVGQEVIARATNFGGVKHILVGLDIEGTEPPAVGSALVEPASEKNVGELTSVCRSPTLGRVIGLGYVRRAYEAVGTTLRLVGPEGAATPVRVAPLPLVARRDPEW